MVTARRGDADGLPAAWTGAGCPICPAGKNRKKHAILIHPNTHHFQQIFLLDFAITLYYYYPMVQIPRRRYTRWTLDREKHLTDLWNGGAQVPAIATALGVTLKAVYKKVWTLRGRGIEKRKAGRPRKEKA